MKNDLLTFDFTFADGEILTVEANFTTEADGENAVDSFCLFTDEGAEIELVPPASEVSEGGWWSPAFRVALAECID